MDQFLKDPEAVLDFAVDWNDTDDPWLDSGETIDSYTVTVPSGITKDSDSQSGGVVTIWLSGGTAGSDYTIEVKIVTSDGRTDERSFRVKVVDR